jgi:hypothetical protein
MRRFTDESGEQSARCLVGWKVSVQSPDTPTTITAIVYGVAPAQAPTQGFAGGMFDSFKMKPSADDYVKNRVLVFEPQPAGQCVFGPKERGSGQWHRRRVVGEYASRRQKGKYVAFPNELAFKDPELRFEFKRRVSGDELQAACDSAGMPRGIVSRSLKQLPQEDVVARRSYDFELAALLELDTVEKQVTAGEMRRDAQSHMVSTLVNFADEAEFWGKGDLQESTRSAWSVGGAADSLGALAQRLYTEDQARRQEELLREKTTAYEAASRLLREGREKFTGKSFERACELFQVRSYSPLPCYLSILTVAALCVATEWVRYHGQRNSPGLALGFGAVARHCEGQQIYV